jgi:hypothetical protein
MTDSRDPDTVISRLRNPVETCGWCEHPMDMHDFTHPEGVNAVPCAHCTDNICDIERLDPHGGADGTVTLQLP